MIPADKTQIQNDADREVSRRLSLEGSRPPAEIEGYSIVRRLGTGAYGTVWLAREDRTGRMVAIKFYPHRRGLNWSMLHREVEKLAAVYTSRFIVRLLDVGWNSEPPYFVMEFVENGSLGSYLSGGPLDVSEAVRITREVCSALIDAHGAGVLHCDLKPDNVLLDGQLHARICDFGQARMSHEQSPALGTLFYMAPEQADLEALPDARWDVYAVGAMFYQMITGEPPFHSDELRNQLEAAGSLPERLRIYRSAISVQKTVTKHRRLRGVDPHLADIIDRCLEVDPARRLPNAQAIRDELDSRDRQRTRRPLFLLGVVSPILLIAAIVPIFVAALRDNLQITRQELTVRALESDALSARLQAASLEGELQDRLEDLERTLADGEVSAELEHLMNRPVPDIVREMTAAHDADFTRRPRWMQLLDASRERSNQVNLRRGRATENSWFLTNSEGYQLWRRDFSAQTIGKQFNWRDYFHGKNADYDPEYVPERLQPIQERHVSIAFRSEATGRYIVALSVPVRNNAGAVTGVLAQTVQLGDLQASLGQRLQSSGRDNVQRIVALADSRKWQLIDHPWLSDVVRSQSSSSTSTPTMDRVFAGLRMNSGTRSQIEAALAADSHSTRDIRLANYEDPAGLASHPTAARYRGPWMAAMAPVTNQRNQEYPWMVIVQEQQSEALKPLVSMADRAYRLAVIAVATALSLMAVVWTFVWRAFRRPSATARRPAEGLPVPLNQRRLFSDAER